MNHDHSCKISDKLDLVHRWAHVIKDAHDDDELERVQPLAQKLLDLLNETEECNGIKFLAIFEVLSVGADQMEYDMHMNSDASTATIN